MPCVSADVTNPVVSSAKGSLLYWWLKVAVPKTRGGRIEESWVRLPFADEYGIGFCLVGKVLVVLGCSVGVVAMAEFTEGCFWGARNAWEAAVLFATGCKIILVGSRWTGRDSQGVSTKMVCDQIRQSGQSSDKKKSERDSIVPAYS